MTTVYCFVNDHWDTDVVSAAICAVCGAVVGGHVSSNTDFARFDMTRDFHRREYEQHARDEHGAATVEIRWLDKPDESDELLKLLERKKE